MTAPMLDGVDWEVVGIFAALVLMEGLRRVPAGALLVRARAWGGWEPAAETEMRARWRLVSWWSPLFRSLVLPPLDGPGTLTNEELTVRLRMARRAAPWLAGGGLLTITTLVLGLPLATARLGALGFFAGALVVLGLALTTAVGGAMTLRRLNVPARRRRRAVGWCSPFASGRVIEGVYEAALEGASAAQAVRALAGEQVFAAWARARAYDVVHGGCADPDLSLAADLATLTRIVTAEPRLEPGGRSYCPRCGATLSLVCGSCPGCAVALVCRTVEPGQSGACEVTGSESRPVGPASPAAP